MKDKKFYTEAKRKTLVTKTQVTELPEGNRGRPKKEWLDHPSYDDVRQLILDGDSIWDLIVFYRTGLYSEESFRNHFATKEHAEAARADYHIGAEISGIEIDPIAFHENGSKEFSQENLSLQTIHSMMGEGEPPYELIQEVLEGAGVNAENWGGLSDDVKFWLGEDGERALRAGFGENWEVVAAMEYCVKHFHPDSLVMLAARIQVGDYISTNQFACGYLSRELKLQYSDLEHLALKTLEARKNAGSGGGRASRERRSANLDVLVEEIENLSGAVGLISEDRIVEQAFEAASERKPNFPKSKKTLDDYGTALRSEEPFKSRYEAVFRKNA